MNLATMWEEIRGTHHDVTEDDIRQAFGDYHNLLCWLATFLIADDKLTDACMVDASTIAERQTPVFHEWLVHWAARATIECALQEQHPVIAELASKYETSEPVHLKHAPLSREYFLVLVKNSKVLRADLDPLCRFVLVLCGIAKNSYDEVAAQLGISRSAVEQAYCVAFDTLEIAAHRVPSNADVSASHSGKARQIEAV
jgi:DNA-directed RNA polymerase specialized sigma24 family protein